MEMQWKTQWQHMLVSIRMTEEADSTQMTKTVKILAQITSKQSVLLQTSVHEEKPKFLCYSIREVKGGVSVMKWEII